MAGNDVLLWPVPSDSDPDDVRLQAIVSTYTYTGAGGIVSSGSANLSKGKAYAGAGGGVLAGAAACSLVSTAVAATQQPFFWGIPIRPLRRTAPISRIFEVVGAGGVDVAGAARTSRVVVKAYSARGGRRIRGVARALRVKAFAELEELILMGEI